MSQARLPHRRRDGFDGRQHGIDQLGELTGRPLGLSARLHDEPGQGPYVHVKHRLIRHLAVGGWSAQGGPVWCPGSVCSGRGSLGECV